MKFNPLTPHNELPLLPPKETIETTAILKKTITAGRALAELKGIGSTIPNQSILINTITLQEAKSSSEIENIVTTNDALFKAFTTQSPQVDAATKEVLRYRKALWEAFSTLKKRPVITTNLLIKLVQIIKQNEAGIRNAPGTAIANTSTGEVIYTPPEGESIIRDKLKNLEDARKKLPSRVYSKELIELIFHQPYTKGQFLVDAGIAERQTAAEYLKELEKAGILKVHKIGRENLYLNVKLYRLLSQ